MIRRTPFAYLRGPRSSPLLHRLALISPRPFQSSQVLVRRPYSSPPEAETTGTTTKPTASDDAPPAQEDLENSAEPENSLRREVEEKKREIIDLKDKYLRSVAEFRNLQDRTARDVAAARDFAISRFANDLLDSVDNLDRALLTVPEVQLRLPPDDGADGTGEAPNKDLVNLHDGLKMTERVLMSTLTKHGLVRFDPSQSGERFDPSLHEATFMAPVEGKEDGTVFNTIQKGFKLNGRVIRAAKVGVVKNT